MTDLPRLKVLLVAPHLDAEDVGESMTAFHLVKEMSQRADLTVLALECTHGPPLAEQLPDAEVITWDEPAWMRRNMRLRALLKPNVSFLARRVKRWLATALAEGRPFDIAHQILPRAPRYSTALRHFDMPYVVGSLGGSLPTPKAFQKEVATERWYTRLRSLDPLRLRFDPWLRASYGKAALVLGVAPYMRDVLAAAPIQRFEPFLGIGLAEVPAPMTRTSAPGQLKLLHVGRAVRTKGLRDCVRSLALLPDLPGVHLTAIGDGEELALCRAEAETLGVADRITLLGRLPRNEIEAHYQAADALIFPSFRESMGGVLYEAMRWSLPVITTRLGGPGFIVDDSCGLRVDVETPEQLSRDLALAIRRLATDPELRSRLGQKAREKVATEALWGPKAEALLALYQEVCLGAK